MRILVTGGAGFVGSHVVDELIARGCDDVVVDALLRNAHRRTPDYLNPRADYLRVALEHAEQRLASIARRVEAVSHQAAMVGLGGSFADVTAYVARNDMGTATLLRALHSAGFAGRLVLASSMVVYGEGVYGCPTHGEVRPPARARARLDEGAFEHPARGAARPSHLGR